LKHGNSLVGGWVKRQFYEGTDWPHFLIPSPGALETHLKSHVLGLKDRPFVEDDKLREKIKAVQTSWQLMPKDEQYKLRLNALARRVRNLYSQHLQQLSDYRMRVSEADNVVEKREIFEEFRQTATGYNQLRSM